jgi:hypothetical protein
MHINTVLAVLYTLPKEALKGSGLKWVEVISIDLLHRTSWHRYILN